MSPGRVTQHCAALAAAAFTLSGCAGAVESAATQSTSVVSDPASAEPAGAASASGASAADSVSQSPEEAVASNGLASVQADVETVAVSLESFYRGTPYPQDLDTVIGTLDDAGLRLTKGNRIGSYVYDPATVEFTLCVEDQAGAWATYDTAPMTLRESGESGACPS